MPFPRGRVHDALSTRACVWCPFHERVYLMPFPRARVHDALSTRACAWCPFHERVYLMPFPRARVHDALSTRACAWCPFHEDVCLMPFPRGRVHDALSTRACAWCPFHEGVCMMPFPRGRVHDALSTRRVPDALSTSACAWCPFHEGVCMMPFPRGGVHDALSTSASGGLFAAWDPVDFHLPFLFSMSYFTTAPFFSKFNILRTVKEFYFWLIVKNPLSKSVETFSGFFPAQPWSDWFKMVSENNNGEVSFVLIIGYLISTRISQSRQQAVQIGDALHVSRKNGGTRRQA